MKRFQASSVSPHAFFSPLYPIIKHFNSANDRHHKNSRSLRKTPLRQLLSLPNSKRLVCRLKYAKSNNGKRDKFGRDMLSVEKGEQRHLLSFMIIRDNSFKPKRPQSKCLDIIKLKIPSLFVQN